MDEIEVLPGVRASRHYALVLEQEELIVAADLHLGYEGALLEQGVSIPRFQKSVIKERLTHLIDAYPDSRVVIVGDFKHEFSRNLQQEWEEVNEVLDFLLERAEVDLIRGNHDNFLRTILSRKGQDLKMRVLYGDYTFAHGHREVAWNGTLVMGHEHPSLGLRDKIGATTKIPCFLVSSDLIVLPALSPLALGTDVTTFRFISPLLRKTPLDDCRVYAIEEKTGLMDFGKLKSLPGTQSRR